jgi:hypothetical protein
MTLRIIRGVTLGATLSLALVVCTRLPADRPGPEDQAPQHPERNIASQHTVPPDPNAIPAEESRDDPDSMGTVRTPPSAPARPMDEAPE